MRLYNLVAGWASILVAHAARDPNSVANIDVFQTTHIHLAWDVDFNTSTIEGIATLTLKRVGQGNKLILDCSHLRIHTVAGLISSYHVALEYSKDSSASPFGGALTITIPYEFDNYTIDISYSTTKKSTALQWLTPEQTLGKTHPYMFSQCQAIHARSMLPCQDTPAIKATYSAHVTVPKPLNVVMSANRREEFQVAYRDDRIVHFGQTTPIPAYLIAIAVGDIHPREIGPRSAVWSEAENLEAAAEEFSETETFIKTAESLVGPYVWERYDILVLPPSFPYGGMENPCLTFVTPTIIAGDKSLVDVVAHEIAHSWTGNLVSCASWEHSWLNEGFTMYLERKILARTHGEEERQLSSIVGLSALKEDLEFLRNGPLTKLVPDLSATDPDDAFSEVPYEKGYLLLYTLEELVGAAKFEVYFKAHIEKFAGESIDTHQFKAFIMEYFLDDSIHQQLIEFPWDEWLHGTGLGPSTPTFNDELAIPCRLLAEAWIENDAANEIDFSSFRVWQKIMFLDNLLDAKYVLSAETIDKLAHEYQLPNCTNMEILVKWYILCIKSRAEHYYEVAAQHAATHGVMGHSRSIYNALYQSGPVGKYLALETFYTHRAVYHPIAANMISKDLGL
ncbi:Peptidase M1, membrane alanine aminopeptidase domain-containing protein [Paramicrosporidium saccamoebae]|uniref:Peptidase M1, membrane alanine aminopeptidase domain-containing protein n=1 Tax=Paramicrosporidium saccamoebae TaxID=1246581 RepID=A0A2H9TFX3_9FUNG|nr:Peptidase M1, membrane alanine aminopeptidase domain-containing protein [Paramicrosporidium saccamoebae]